MIPPAIHSRPDHGSHLPSPTEPLSIGAKTFAVWCCANARKNGVAAVKTFFRDNGLTIALVTPFLFSALGMIWWGHSAYNEELQHHGSAAIGLLAYLTSGDFLSALFENWESEFLQMSAYVVLPAMLFQRGSAESRDPDDPTGLTTSYRLPLAGGTRFCHGFIPTRWA
jgi:hypothetical protein